ncbi:MAG: tetratricopeptide repeat protein, partial [Woeseiaceae bacterium]
MKMRYLACCFLLTGLAACGTTEDRSGTLAELDNVPPDLDEIYLDDSLERAAQSYRRYLEETSESARTPEAMRRLADLQIEQAYGVLGSATMVEMAAPETAVAGGVIQASGSGAAPGEPTESELEFEQRATRESFHSQSTDYRDEVAGDDTQVVPAGPREAIATYQKILETYPDYERNDKVLYQMSRAYDEIGEPDKAMAVMDRLVL